MSMPAVRVTSHKHWGSTGASAVSEGASLYIARRIRPAYGGEWIRDEGKKRTAQVTGWWTEGHRYKQLS